MKQINKIKVKILGSSSAESFPRDDGCAQCKSHDAKDTRKRSALLVNRSILIDAGPDILKQLHKEQIEKLEAVLITHEHDDHIGGLKDIMKIKRDVRIIKLKPGQHFKLLGVDFYAFKVKHSKMITTVGVEIDDAVYIPDYADLDWAMKYLTESQVAILDGSVLGQNYAGHMSINESVAATKPLTNLKKIYFTHNGHTHRPHAEMEKLVQTIGDNRFVIAYDGLEIEI